MKHTIFAILLVAHSGLALAEDFEEQSSNDIQVADIDVLQSMATVWLEYGHACDPNNSSAGECNALKSYDCHSNDSRCWCKNATTMYYEPPQEQCVVLAGRSCLELVSHDYPTKCTLNSHCNQTIVDATNGICVCNPGTEQEGDFCKANAGGPCEVTRDCFNATNNFLVCGVNKTCECDLLTEWNSGVKMCLSLLGGPCTTDTRPCKDSDLNITVCAADTNTCACNNETRVEYQGQCYLKLDQNCTNAPDECHPDFPCDSTNKCSCPAGEYVENLKCVLQVDQPCNGANSTKACGSHAQCLPEQNGNGTTCQCETGYKPNGQMICKGVFNTTCPGGVTDCNADLGLICDQGNKCVCKDNYVHDNVEGRCKGNLNADCSVDEDCQTGVCTGTPGKCSCPADTNALNNTCYATHGKNCSVWGCRPDYWLICQNDTCACDETNFHYDSNLDPNKCRAKVDVECSIGTKECVESAQCERDGSSSNFVCKCLSGFRKNETNAFCYRSGGQGLGASLAVLIIGVLSAFNKS